MTMGKKRILQQKAQEISTGAIKQGDAVSNLGASEEEQAAGYNPLMPALATNKATDRYLAAIRDAKQTMATSWDESPVKRDRAGKFSTKAESGNGDDDDPGKETPTDGAGPQQPPTGQKQGQAAQQPASPPPTPPLAMDCTGGPPDDNGGDGDKDKEERLKKLEENKAKSPTKPYDYAADGSMAAHAKFEGTGSTGWSFDPKTGIAIDVTLGKDHGIRLYDNLIKTTPSLEDGKPIYITGVTNNAKTGSAEARQGYAMVENELSESPLIGYWKDEDTGEPYHDIAYPTNFESPEAALENAKKYNQISVLVVQPNGDHSFPKTGIRH